MNQKNMLLLQSMISELSEEKELLSGTIQNNREKIYELKIFVKSLTQNRDEDQQVFSPRKNDSLDDEVQKSQVEIMKLEEINQDNEMILTRLEIHMANLEAITKGEIEAEEEYDRDIQKQHNLRVLSVQEEERKRIAADLHDIALQNLAHMVHKIELSSLFIDQDPLRAKLELSVLRKGLKEIIEEIRDTIFDLRPMTFDDLGIKTALERILKRAKENTRLEVTDDIENIAIDNNLILMSIYRIAQECIANAVKHSGGTRLDFICRQKGNECFIKVEDNGKGFIPEQIKEKKERHFGIDILKERVALLGGNIEIFSQVDRGTKVTVRIPI